MTDLAEVAVSNLTDAAEGSGNGITGIFHNGAFVAAFLGFLFAQVAKIFTHYYVNQEWDLSRCVSSGGMPSSHTSFVMGLTTALAVLYGASSPVFAISLVFSLIVRHFCWREDCSLQYYITKEINLS